MGARAAFRSRRGAGFAPGSKLREGAARAHQLVQVRDIRCRCFLPLLWVRRVKTAGDAQLIPSALAGSRSRCCRRTADLAATSIACAGFSHSLRRLRSGRSRLQRKSVPPSHAHVGASCRVAAPGVGDGAEAARRRLQLVAEDCAAPSAPRVHPWRRRHAPRRDGPRHSYRRRRRPLRRPSPCMRPHAPARRVRELGRQDRLAARAVRGSALRRAGRLAPGRCTVSSFCTVTPSRSRLGLGP